MACSWAPGAAAGVRHRPHLLLAACMLVLLPARCLAADFGWQLHLDGLDAAQVNGTLRVFAFVLGRHGVGLDGERLPSSPTSEALQHEAFCDHFASDEDDIAGGHGHRAAALAPPPSATAAAAAAPSAGARALSVSLELTDCLQRAGIATAVPLADPADVSKGPARVPFSLADVALTASENGRDFTASLKMGRPAITWSLVQGDRLYEGVAAQGGGAEAAALKAPAVAISSSSSSQARQALPRQSQAKQAAPARPPGLVAKLVGAAKRMGR